MSCACVSNTRLRAHCIGTASRIPRELGPQRPRVTLQLVAEVLYAFEMDFVDSIQSALGVDVDATHSLRCDAAIKVLCPCLLAKKLWISACAAAAMAIAAEIKCCACTTARGETVS